MATQVFSRTVLGGVFDGVTPEEPVGYDPSPTAAGFSHKSSGTVGVFGFGVLARRGNAPALVRVRLVGLPAAGDRIQIRSVATGDAAYGSLPVPSSYVPQDTLLAEASLSRDWVATRAFLLGPLDRVAVFHDGPGTVEFMVMQGDDLLLALAGSGGPALANDPPTQIDVGDAAQVGVATEAARADHQHALPAPGAPVAVTRAPASAGASATVARADHKHDVATDVPVTAAGPTNAEGASTSLARADHQHRAEVGVQLGGVPVGSRPTLNLIGAVVTAVDNGGQDRVDVTISGGAGDTLWELAGGVLRNIPTGQPLQLRSTVGEFELLGPPHPVGLAPLSTKRRQAVALLVVQPVPVWTTVWQVPLAGGRVLFGRGTIDFYSGTPGAPRGARLVVEWVARRDNLGGAVAVAGYSLLTSPGDYTSKNAQVVGVAGNVVLQIRFNSVPTPGVCTTDIETREFQL